MTTTTQERQLRVVSLYYRARPGSERATSLLNEYNRLTLDNLSELGDDAHCAQVDPMLYSLYSDLYRDVTGFRPHGHVTVATAHRWSTEAIVS